MESKRFYSSSDVDMLTACSIVVDRAIEQKELLIARRASWADPYFANLKLRISKTYDEQLGVNSNVEMRKSTQEADSARDEALKALKVLLEEVRIHARNEPARRDEILKQLGYADSNKWKKQKDVLEHLQVVKLALTESLIAELKQKGIDPALLALMGKHADNVRQTYIFQKNTKGLRKKITRDSVGEMNKLFLDVSDICRLIRVHFPKDNLMKERYCYQSILSTLRQTTSVSQSDPTPSSDAIAGSKEDASTQKTA